MKEITLHDIKKAIIDNIATPLAISELNKLAEALYVMIHDTTPPAENPGQGKLDV